MRTTLDLDDDILGASREIARRQKKSTGKVISELVRAALSTSTAPPSAEEAFSGFRPFPPRGAVVTNTIIDKLREEGD